MHSAPLKPLLLLTLLTLIMAGSALAGPPRRPARTQQAVTLAPGSHTLFLESTASPSEVHAAQELQAHFRTAFGAELPLVQGTPPSGPLIVIGQGPTARGLGVDPTPDSLGEQGFLLRTVPPHLVIAGTPAAGTLYGVHRLEEDYLGIRWYAPGVTDIPPQTAVTLPDLNRLEKPAFDFRNIYYAWPGKDADFLAHMGDNAGSGTAQSPTGVEYAFDGICHTYFNYVSPDEFFDTHPEYFSEIGGVRIRRETQLCLTNPDVLEIVASRMLARMAANPSIRQHNFSQMDWYNYCECDRCRAINEAYGTTGGTQLWFVNQLAERIAAVYPDKLVSTLAYTYTEEPPVGLEVHPNVAVWLCHMYPSCDSHAIDTCPLNATYKRRAEDWASLTDHLYIWHYITNFTHYYEPFPNLRAMSADMRFYRDIGVEGIFQQGMNASGGGGEWSLLRPYYGAKLLWNPDLDPDGILKDFLEGYYGAAWRPLWSYINLLHDKVDNDDVHMHLYTNPGQGYLPDDILQQAHRLFAQAEQAVRSDPTLLDRVKVAALPLTYAQMFPRNGYSLSDRRLNFEGRIASYHEMENFFTQLEAHGFSSVSELIGGTDILTALWAIFKSRPPVQLLSNPSLEVQVVPALAGRALRIIDRVSGQDVTAYNVVESLYFPLAGGLEDRVGELSGYYGWLEPALVVDQTPELITTQATTLDGFTLTRTLELDEIEPLLSVTTTLTNPKSSAAEVRLRSHLELELGTLEETLVSFVDKAGYTQLLDMTQVIAGQREGQHFYREEAPAGSWQFSGTKGLTVTQHFAAEALESGWLYAYPTTQNELEVELWAPRALLQPGESLTFHQVIEVRPTE